MKLSRDALELHPSFQTHRYLYTLSPCSVRQHRMSPPFPHFNWFQMMPSLLPATGVSEYKLQEHNRLDSHFLQFHLPLFYVCMSLLGWRFLFVLFQ